MEKLALLVLGDEVFDDGGDGFVVGVFGVVVGGFGEKETVEVEK